MTLRTSPRLLYCAAWAFAGFYNFCRGAIVGAQWMPNLIYNIFFFSVWAVLGLITLALLRRVPLRAHWRGWTIHLIAALVLTQTDVTAGSWLAMHTLDIHEPISLAELGAVAEESFRSCFLLALLNYGCFIGTVHGLAAMRLAQTRDLQIEEHKTALVHAQLQSLRSQLQPHFLFNTLHAISSFMHYDVPTADRMLNRLSELLRISLRETGNQVVTLRQEIAFIEAYVDIEKIRFEHRLDVAWAIPDDLQGSSIPPFILQPLVENAIKHGVAPRAAGGSIVIRAYADAGSLTLEVEDDVPALLPRQKGFGIGLSNTRSRLETLYGAGQRFELLREGMGTIARIRLPLFPVAA